MSIYIYCRRPSNGAREIVDAIDGTRLRRWDGMNFWRGRRKIRFAGNDVIVCWGEVLPELDGVRVLNGGKFVSKKAAVEKFLEAKVPTITIQDGRYSLGDLPQRDGAGERLIWLPRRNDHVGGDDLLENAAGLFKGKPDFWSLK